MSAPTCTHPADRQTYVEQYRNGFPNFRVVCDVCGDDRLTSPSAMVIAKNVPAEYQAEVSLYANFLGNIGGGRPSSNAARAVDEFNRLGIHDFRIMRADDRKSAFAACASAGCGACADSLSRVVS